MTDNDKSKTAAKKTAAKAPAKKAAAKRRNLTPEERVAVKEQELRDAREAADKANAKKVTDLKEKRDKLVPKRDKLVREVSEVEAELERLERQPVGTDPVVQASDRAAGEPASPSDG